ncbi:MAG: 4-alpha-glucanotransferase, partial [Clostridia bacterium]|nr:4-alpha-glucanotransferase [Clostridia bacterium]
QLWGNPLYRWDYHKQTGYSWWMSRLWYCYQLYDVTRIDHFRGFDEYFSIPAGSENAKTGHWEKGPGIDLFRCAQWNLGWHEVIAEDLGYVTDTVRQLVRESGFPGMKVLEFAFDSRDSGSANDYLPHNYVENSVAYTGTHDNETVAGWLDSITEEEFEMARRYVFDHRTPKNEFYKPFIAEAMRSVAKYCIVPMQDWLGLDNSCRMNKPSTIGANWRWRVTKQQLTQELLTDMLDMTKCYGRMNWEAYHLLKKQEENKNEAV